MLKRWFSHPLTRDIDLDDPLTTKLRHQVIRQNAFLSQIYSFWYGMIKMTIPEGAGQVLELGSGAGFLSEHIPGLITSEVFFLDTLRIILDGQALPFSDGALKAIAMTDVLHHIPSVRRFFFEATRVIKPGGVISIIEPWVSNWSRFVYSRLHHEVFEPEAKSWEFVSSGPLSGANAALPWILFHRDRKRFEQEFPSWRVERIVPIMPFAYLISGGISMRSVLPGWSFRLFQKFDSMLSFAMPRLAMFAHIVLVRVSDENIS
jgi:SAM-dependent methyltransferase